MTTRFPRVLALLAALAGGCSTGEIGPGLDGPGVPVEGNAFLTVVGDRDVFMEAGTSSELVVFYHDDANEPLAGEVSFAIEGDAAGGVLARATAVTDRDGLARVVLNAGRVDEAAFRVAATAVLADAVDWSVAVTAVAPTTPLDATGSYELKSQFDLVSGLPGTAGDIINGFLDMTDDPNDPATWLLDEALEVIDSDTVTDLVDVVRPGLDSLLNDYIRSNAPDLVTSLLEIGDKLGQVTRKFGVTSRLEVSAVMVPDPGLVGRHTVTGIQYIVDGVTYEFTMAELELGEVTVEGVGLELVGQTKLTVAEHALPVSYGRLLLFGLNHVIIPLIDPYAADLGDVLASRVNCYEVGWAVYDYLSDPWGLTSPGLFESACEAGLDAAADAIEDLIAGIGGEGAALVIHGDARPRDTNLDHKVDRLQTGLWEGAFRIAGAESVLSRPDQKWSGARMGLD